MQSPFRYLIIFLCLCFSQPVLSGSEQWEDHELQQQKLDALKQNISKLRTWIDGARGEQSQLEKDLRATEEKIQAKVREINAIESDIHDTEAQIRELESEEKEHLASLNQQQALLGKQIRAAYAMGQEQGIKLLLNAEDPLKLQRLMNYYGYLNRARGDQIEEYRDTIDQLKQTRAGILERNQELISFRNNLARARENLEGQRKERAVTLAKLTKSLNYKKNELVRMEKDQQQLETLVQEVEKTISNLELTQDSVPFAKLRAKLPWPTSGKMQRNFGRSAGGKNFRMPGVFFSVPVNTPVKAVHHGRVVFSDWLRGFGLLMIIDHGDGYMSLYGFNQALLKDTGDWVNSGELIASAGNSGGQQESGLYFEIRHKGKPDNPAKWLK
ncbi:metallopeptidase [Hahella sp. CCB-MM4]|uniref:murein hydrolase activator EnvC family protein n=1 Tax=Hahella sp. (strain CCB-MM4) TaxID=1926491 RepID=UPI000B9B2176|nr:peptidoglycan DD-metalloendopeptidase family protein [Hahella sp. CCB-MM4]OZG71781.1 metallopeptidase [Hahella sp. CCB-MM4]